MNNIKPRILMYDLVIILLFSFLIFVIAGVERSVLCGACFSSVYGPIIDYILGVSFIVGLCYLNHSKNNKEPTPKWHAFILYIFIAFIIFIFANVAIVMLGEAINIGASQNSF